MPDIENNEELAPIDPIDPIETDDLIETDEPDENVNIALISVQCHEEEIVTLAEISIPDFPTPFYHASNSDGTRAAVTLSELKDYLNSMK